MVVELKRAVAYAHTKLGRKLDVLAMDACLMTMIEVAWQVRGHASVLVGSEEEEPGDGWPYNTVLGDLAAPVELLHVRVESSGEDLLLEAYLREP